MGHDFWGGFFFFFFWWGLESLALEEEGEGDVKRLRERAVERKYPDRSPRSAEENAMAYIEGEDGDDGGESEVDMVLVWGE